MVYMGSKTKYAKYIVPILQELIDKHNISTYIEPFVGGANIIDKIKCQEKFGYDKNLTLIALHCKGQTAPDDIPAHGNREWWDKAKTIYQKYKGSSEMANEMELWSIGAIQFFGSFNNGGFSRGFASSSAQRDYYNEAYRNFLKQTQSPLYQDIKFICEDYKNLINFHNCLLYCDPPYQGTKPYGYKFETNFDYNYYWDWIRKMSQNNLVVCSEQVLPDDFDIIWKTQTTRTNSTNNNFKATEKLGMYKDTKLI